jgi:nucleoside-diphosphate-sugar epimerase
MTHNILVVGGAGYIGTALTQRLLRLDNKVRVLDTFWFGDFLSDHPDLTRIQGDMRDTATVNAAMDEVDVVISLACLSNDPTSNLDSDLTREINYTAARNVILVAKENGVKRFIFTSSASVYGIKEELDVREDAKLEPITLYSKYKAEVEAELFATGDRNFTTVAVRNSTACGYSPRMRIDTVVNIFVSVALKKGVINIEGGQQVRPLIHIDDLVDFYVLVLDVDSSKIHNQAFNVSYANYKVIDVAKMVQERIPCRFHYIDWTDPRSYHVSTEKAFRTLGYKPSRPIEVSIDDLKQAFQKGLIDVDDVRCYNIKRIKELGIKRVSL